MCPRGLLSSGSWYIRAPGVIAVGGSSEMSLLNRVIEARLGAILERAGFVMVDRNRLEANDDGEVERLEYRLERTERRVLLDFCHIGARRTVSAMLWSPTDLARAGTDSEVDDIALSQRTWHYDAPAHPDPLAGEIASEVAVWLEQAPWSRMPC